MTPPLSILLAVSIIVGVASRMSLPSVSELIPSSSKYPFQIERWNKADIRPSERGEVDMVAKSILSNQSRYTAISKQSGVNWKVVGCIHNMECSLSFRKHLHEGSKLSGRTRWHPRGRPTEGYPPFSFEESALDSLRYDRMDRWNYNDFGELLQALELYNGAGYQKYHKDVPSPYLWSKTTIYTKGKYVSDGKWSSSAVSKQVGCAAILKVLCR